MRELIGLTGQFAAVDEILTGRENLEMFGRLFDLSKEEAARRAGELLERFDLADAADRPARTYSGGMRRRLDLASSLTTAAAHPLPRRADDRPGPAQPQRRSGAIVRELIREGTTVLLTTQYLEEADELADRIAVIDHGRVIAEGTGNELKDRVGGQILEVELVNAGQREQACVALAGIGCGDPEPDERRGPGRGAGAGRGRPGDDRGRSLRAAPGRDRGERPGLRRPTLDDVFLQLTGAPPSENGGRAGDQRRSAGSAAARRGRACRRAARVRLRAPSLAAAARVRQRRRRRHRAQPAPLLAPAAAADLLDRPADHVRAAVRLRVRRRDQGLAARGRLLHRLPAAGHLRPVRRLPGDADGGRPLGGPRARRGRPVPLDADGALGRAGRPHDRRPGPQHR